MLLFCIYIQKPWKAHGKLFIFRKVEGLHSCNFTKTNTSAVFFKDLEHKGWTYVFYRDFLSKRNDSPSITEMEGTIFISYYQIHSLTILEMFLIRFALELIVAHAIARMSVDKICVPLEISIWLDVKCVVL